MYSSTYKVNKLLFLERTRHSYMDPGHLNSELHNLLIPEAGIYFRHDAECDILSQHIQLPGFSVWINDIFSKKDIVLRPFIPVSIHTLHFMFEDSLQAQFRHGQGYLLEERECNIFNLQPGLHKIPMTNNKKILSVHINIDKTFISSLVQQYPVLQFLEQSINTTGPVNIHPYLINPVCDLLVKQMLTCSYTGIKAKHFLYRCCIDLLLNIARQQAATSQRLLFSTVMNGSLYQELFQYIEDHPHKQHTASELAYIFNIPTEQLSYAFLQLFAITVEDFIHMTKMMFIYNRIESKAFPLSLIAKTVGYNDISRMVSDTESFYGNPIF
jgi:AraC-like DNA-binding protein